MVAGRFWGRRGGWRHRALITIESFVGQNLAELAQFDRAAFARQLAALLKEYNTRAAVERDESLFINIPAAIQQQDG